MARLVFFDQGHQYEMDGERLPSVSELCRFIARETYADVAQYNLDRAAERGTLVHKACEALDVYGRAEVDEAVAGYVNAYAMFRRDHVVEWRMVEKSMHHPVDRYAGTIDRYGTLDGVETLLDIKTSYTVHKRLAVAQLNLYRRMLEANGVQPARLVILHLQRDGYKLVEMERRDDVPDALLTLQRLMEPQKRKRRKTNGK